MHLEARKAAMTEHLVSEFPQVWRRGLAQRAWHWRGVEKQTGRKW